VDLGQDVADAGRLEDGADRATGDDAGALAGGLEQDAAGAVDDLDLVGDRRPDHRDLDQVLLRVLDALADRLRDLAGLAEPDPDVARAVTDDDDRAEAEPPAALDDLGDSVDLDDALLERELIGSIRATVAPSDQNSRPASRAASASDLIRPWYRNPARSKTTRSTPAAWPARRRAADGAASSDLVDLEPLSSFSTVEAAASVFPDASSMTCA
jgi:hypothetical protein